MNNLWQVIGGSSDAVIVRQLMTAARTYYVRPDGSDSNAGLANTADGAFLTIQRAVDVVLSSIDAGSYAVTVQLADGTYAPFFVTSPMLGQTPFDAAGAVNGTDYNFIIQGNATSPQNVIINDDAFGYCLFAFSGANVLLKDVTLTGTSNTVSISSSNFAQVAIGNIRFGAASVHMQASNFGMIRAVSSYKIVANIGFCHMFPVSFGFIDCLLSGITITLEGTPVFGFFIFAENHGDAHLEAVTFSGAGSGVRYGVGDQSTIYADSASGATFLPGDVPGVCYDNGVYFPLNRQTAVMTLVNGANANVAMLSAGTRNVARIAGPTGAFSISGFALPSYVGDVSVNNMQLMVINPTAQNMTITNDATSTAINRILTMTGADVTLTGASVANFIYSLADSRWLLTGTQG